LARLFEVTQSLAVVLTPLCVDDPKAIATCSLVASSATRK